MKVFNVISSHYVGSFNLALANRFNEVLAENGHEFANLDLYQEEYEPVMKGDDFNQFFGKPLPEETRKFHDRIKDADVLTFFYPVWWNDMPAIMKGWIDRVFTKGFAYDVSPEGRRGVLPVKKVILVCTLGNKRDEIHHELEDAMRVKEEHGVFKYCGVPEVEHLFLYEVDTSEEIREECMRKVGQLAANLSRGW